MIRLTMAACQTPTGRQHRSGPADPCRASGRTIRRRRSGARGETVESDKKKLGGQVAPDLQNSNANANWSYLGSPSRKDVFSSSLSCVRSALGALWVVGGGRGTGERTGREQKSDGYFSLLPAAMEKNKRLAERQQGCHKKRTNKGEMLDR